MSVENLPGDDREQQQDADEARVQLLITKTIERYERRRRRLAKK
ncbi:hypothetical protein ACFYE2_07980 [Kocuria sp. CPCC 205300]